MAKLFEKIDDNPGEYFGMLAEGLEDIAYDDEVPGYEPKKRTWTEERYDELMNKGQDNWDQDDWDSYNYIMQVWGESGVFDESLKESTDNYKVVYCGNGKNEYTEKEAIELAKSKGFKNIAWVSEGRNFSGNYNGDSWLLFNETENLPDGIKQDAKEYGKSIEESLKESKSDSKETAKEIAKQFGVNPKIVSTKLGYYKIPAKMLLGDFIEKAKDNNFINAGNKNRFYKDMDDVTVFVEFDEKNGAMYVDFKYEEEESLLEDKFVSRDKMSKKDRKELDSKKRNTWGNTNPVTRVQPNKKAYDRKRDKKELDEAITNYSQEDIKEIKKISTTCFDKVKRYYNSLYNRGYSYSSVLDFADAFRTCAEQIDSFINKTK